MFSGFPGEGDNGNSTLGPIEAMFSGFPCRELSNSYSAPAACPIETMFSGVPVPGQGVTGHSASDAGVTETVF